MIYLMTGIDRLNSNQLFFIKNSHNKLLAVGYGFYFTHDFDCLIRHLWTQEEFSFNSTILNLERKVCSGIMLINKFKTIDELIYEYVEYLV